MNMTEVKTAELSGSALDWAVAHHLNGDRAFFEAFGARMLGRLITEEVKAGNIRPSTDWAQGGPLIEKHKASFSWYLPDEVICTISGRNTIGPTHLIAAMRAIVAAKLGEVVSVPSELLA